MKAISLLLLILAVLISGIALAYAWTDWSGARQLQAALQQIQQKKEAINLQDLIPPPTPDEENVAAASIFKEFFEKPESSVLGKFQTPWPIQKVQPLPEKGESNNHFVARQIDPSFSGDETAAATLILKALEPSAPLLSEVREALFRPDVVWPLNYSVSPWSIDTPHITPLLRLSQMLTARAIAEVSTGSPDKALEDLETLLALAKACGEPPIMVCVVARASILDMASTVVQTGLDHASWSDSQLATLSVELARPKLLEDCAQALRMDRAMLLGTDLSSKEIVRYLSSVANRDEGGKAGDFSLASRVLNSSGSILDTAIMLRPSGWIDEDKSYALLQTQKIIDSLTSGSASATPDLLGELFIASPKNPTVWQLFRRPASYLLAMDDRGTVRKFCRAQTILTALVAACAVERYRLASHHLPGSLDELPPTYLPAVPKGPMTGEPLQYMQMDANSYVIYGLGWGRKDKGGPGISSVYARHFDQPDWGTVIRRVGT